MAARSWLRFSALLLLCGGMYLSFVSAQEKGAGKKSPATTEFKLPIVFEKHAAPQTVAELRQMEEHIQKVIKKVMPAVVGLRIGQGQGSGVIVKEDGTILTAGHVSGTPRKKAEVTLPNGQPLDGTTLGGYVSIDSGMVKIDAEGKYPFAEIGKSSALKVGQWVLAIGHPGGFRANRTPVVRVGRVLAVDDFIIRTDCTLVGGDSGGPLFDMQGRVVGIHSRIGGFAITENVHVPIDTYSETWKKLARGDRWGDKLGQFAVVKSAGGKLVFEKKDALNNNDAKDTVRQECYAKTYTFRMKAGSTYTIDMFHTRKAKAKFMEGELDPFLRLEDEKGDQVARDDDGAGNMNSRVVYKAIKDGDYKIIATTCDPDETGAYTLKIYEAEFKDAIVSGKVDDLLRAIELPLPVVKNHFGKAIEAKAVHINALIVDAKGNPQAGKSLTFQWDQGNVTLKSDDEGVVRWPLAKDKTRKLALQVPKGLRAMVAATDKNGQSIGLTFGTVKVKSAGGKIVKTFEGKIAKTDPFDLEREKCYRHVHEFKMEAGKTYTLDLVSEDFDAYLRLENDETGKLAEDDDGAGFMNSRIVFTPKTGGTFRLVVTTCDPDQLGAYRLSIREANATPANAKKN